MKDYKKIIEGVVDIINITEKSDIGFANICTYIGENCPELKKSKEQEIRKSIIGFLKTITSLKDGKTVSNKDFDTKAIIEWVDWLEQQGKNTSIEGTLVNVDDARENFIQDVYRVLDADKTCKDKQNPSWSKYDEYYRNIILYCLDNESVGKTDKENAINWLKSLKERVQPQPKQEWSGEDSKRLQRIIDFLWYNRKGDPDTIYQQEQDIEWLKSFRPQNNITDEELAQAKKEAYNEALDKIEYHSGEPTFDDGWSAAIWYLKKRNAQLQDNWKPSDLQIEALESATANCAYSEYEDCLTELIEQLKKLKG